MSNRDCSPTRCYCGLPFLRFQGNVVVVESRHRGRKHINSIAVQDIVRELLDIGECNYGDWDDVIELINSYRLNTYFFKDILMAK